MKSPAARVLKVVLRWGIAIGGIWWVVSQISLRDALLVLDADDLPVRMLLAEDADDSAERFRVFAPNGNGVIEVPRERTINRPDGNARSVTLRPSAADPTSTEPLTRELLGIDLLFEDGRPVVRRLLVREPVEGGWIGRFVGLEDLDEPFKLRVPNLLIERGIIQMLAGADGTLLVAAVMVFPTTFVLTSLRWHRLLRGLGIELPLGRVFVLNMVGAFYNSFLPGSTGGDVLKAIYAARQVENRAAAVMSVVIDRFLGLLTLVVLGAVMASVQYSLSPDKSDPAAVACANVAIAAWTIVLLSVVGTTLLAITPLRKALGLDWLMVRMPGQKLILQVIEVMRMYRSKPLLIAWAIVITIPVHLTVVVSAMLAGNALGLPVSNAYYFVVVPVMVLVGAIPISPQGAGVMELFATMLLARQGAGAGHAFALSMSVRLVQVMWNLTGAILVVRGGYQKPTPREVEEVGA